MIELLYARPAQLLASTLFHFLWQGAVLVMLLKLVEPILRSNSKRYLASVSVLVLMLAMPFATYGLLSGSALTSFTQVRNPDVTDVVTTPSVMSASLSQNIRDMLVRSQPVLVGFWIFGVALLGVRLLAGYAGTVWLRRDCRPLTAQLEQRATWLRQRLGVTVQCRVLLSERVDEAIAIGYFKPLVIVPLAWASELPASVLEAVIAHELAHVRRCDLWVTLLQRLAETLLFYHPAVWWLSSRLTVERELCCDELAVTATQSRVEYVQALETVARRMCKPSLTMATSFLGGGNMNLLHRVRNVLKSGSSHEASDWWPAGFVALIAPAIAALALSGWSPLAATVLADDDDDERKVELRVDKIRDAKRQVLEVGELEVQIDLLKHILTQVQEADEDDDKEEREIKDKNNYIRKRSLGEPVKEDAQHRVYELKRKPQPKKNSDADDDEDGEIDFSDFRPETEREKKLMAVIKKLQSQLKETNSFDKGAVDKDGAKRNYEVEVKKFFLEKQNAAAAEQKRAAAQNELAVRKALEAMDRKAPAVEKKPGKQPKDELKVIDQKNSLQSDKPDIELYRKKLEAVKDQVDREKYEIDKAANELDVKKLQQALELKEAQLRKVAEALQKYEEQELQQKFAPDKEKEVRKPGKPGADKKNVDDDKDDDGDDDKVKKDEDDKDKDDKDDDDKGDKDKDDDKDDNTDSK